MSLKNKVIVVTGGSQGIGRSLAEHYYKAGARVAVLARSTETLNQCISEIEDKTRSNIIRGYSADVTDAQGIAEVFTTIETEMGTIDVLHNNAGVHRGWGPFWEMKPSEWECDMKVNIFGPYYCSRAVVQKMISRKQGIIINTLGGGVKEVPRNMAAYSISKTALFKFTQIMALELEEYGISVFGLFPGLVDTPGNQEKIKRPEVQKWSNLEELLQNSAGNADNPAKLAVKLAGGKYHHLSGQAVSVEDFQN